jgi:hypothetical protein
MDSYYEKERRWQLERRAKELSEATKRHADGGFSEWAKSKRDKFNKVHFPPPVKITGMKTILGSSGAGGNGGGAGTPGKGVSLTVQEPGVSKAWEVGKVKRRRNRRMVEDCFCPECHGEIEAESCRCSTMRMPPCSVCECGVGECSECGYEGNYENWLSAEDMKKEKLEMNTNKLHNALVDGKQIMGYPRAVGGDGLVIFEEHGTNNLHRVPQKDVELIVPYSVGVKFLSAGADAKVYHYYATEGEFAVNDLLLNDAGDYAKVIEINTKNENANKRFKGWKMGTRLLDE